MLRQLRVNMHPGTVAAARGTQHDNISLVYTELAAQMQLVKQVSYAALFVLSCLPH